MGTTLALQAETVNDYVYQQPPKKIVKKGSQDATIVLNGQTIEVRADENVASAGQGLKPIVVGSPNTATDPLVVIDGQVATAEQMKALDPKAIDNVSVVKDEETKVIYAQHFNADTSNGIIFINTKEYVERGGKGVVAVSVKVPAKSTEEQEPFDMVEQMPEFPGGVQALMQFLYENIRYPEAAQTAGKQGRVVVQFVVEADGTVSSAKVVRSISEELDAEALRVVNAMPRWTPGKHKGKAVRVKYTLPVSFRLTPKQSAPVTTEAKPQV